MILDKVATFKENIVTRGEIIIQILCEVSGRPKSELDGLADIIRRKAPNSRWDESVSDDEAAKLITELRAEGPGILAWLVQGAASVHSHIGNA